MTSFRLAVLPGDGIGPEVVAEAVKVLRAVEATSEHTFALTEDLVGGAAIDAFGIAIRPETVALAKRSDAVLFGAVGGPKWDDPKASRPARAGHSRPADRARARSPTCARRACSRRCCTFRR